MKKNLCIILSLCLFLIPIEICSATSENACTSDKDYIKRLEKNINDKNLLIYDLKQKINTLNERLLGSLDNNIINDSHYHPFEVHNENIYYMVKKPSQDYKYYNNLLCRYNDDGKTKLYSTPHGIDFRVAPSNKLISIESDNDLILINSDGNIIKKFTLDDVSLDPNIDQCITPYGWSNDSTVFWGYVSNTWVKHSFFSIDTSNDFEIKKYDTLDLSMEDCLVDSCLNTNTGILCYSTYPIIFDVDGRDEFIKKHTIVNLKTYNLNTGEEKLITSIETNRFEPKWIDDNTIEYFDGNKRVKINL